MLKFSQSINLLALLILPITMVVVNYMGGLVFVILLITGLAFIIRGGLKEVYFSKNELAFFFSLTLIVITGTISAIINDVELGKVDRLIILPCTIPIYILFKRYPVNEAALWIGVSLGAIIAAIVAIFQILLSPGSTRVGGSTNPIMFGDIALVMGFISLAGTSWFFKINRGLCLIPVAAFFSGILASILSLSRGGWLAIPVFLVLFICFVIKRFSLRQVLPLLAIFIVISGTIAFAPGLNVKDKLVNRVERTMINLSGYLESESVDDPVRSTSVGHRLEMWKTSWFIFKEYPLFGVGWGNFDDQAKKYVDKKIVIPGVAKFPHPHSQYFSALAKGGIAGILSVVVLFGVPGVFFISGLRAPVSNQDFLRIPLAGFIFILSFIIFGLTEAVLERSRIIIFFSFYLSVIMAFFNQTNKGDDSNKFPVV